MSENFDFEMEVVDTEAATDSSSDVGQQSSSTEKEKNRRQTETPSAKQWPPIPKDWEMVKGSQVYDANPTRYDADGEVDYIEMDALKTDLPDPKYVGRRDPSEYSGQMFTSGDTLFAQITPCTENGKAALVPEIRSEVGIGSTEFIVLSPDRAEITPEYLYYLSKSHPVHDYAVSRMRGSTGRQRVPVDVFRKELQFPLPPLPEQRKIASVLYTVDQTIQKTEEIIEQAKRVKRGLMQRFFREGFREHSGYTESHHRNCLHQHPNTWEVLPAEEVMEVSRGSHPRPKSDPSLWGGGIPIIKIGDRNRGDRRFVTETTDTVTEKGSESSKRVPEGTLIVSNAGTCGVARIAGMEACVHDHWLILRNYEDRLDTRYLFYYINYNQDFLATLASGSTVDDLNTDDFRLFDIAVPPLGEQREIAATLDGLHDQVMQSKGTVSQLKRLKKGLMQDLLTGEVRTADKAIEVLEEVQAHG